MDPVDRSTSALLSEHFKRFFVNRKVPLGVNSPRGGFPFLEEQFHNEARSHKKLYRR
jgi:hypothetical protein